MNKKWYNDAELAKEKGMMGCLAILFIFMLILIYEIFF